MEYKTHNTKKIDVSEISFLGYVSDTPYEKMFNLFGKSTLLNNPGDAEWHIEFPDGEVCVIYNYEFFAPKEDLTNWKILGSDISVVSKIYKIIYLGE